MIRASFTVFSYNTMAGSREKAFNRVKKQLASRRVELANKRASKLREQQKVQMKQAKSLTKEGSKTPTKSMLRRGEDWKCPGWRISPDLSSGKTPQIPSDVESDRSWAEEKFGKEDAEAWELWEKEKRKKRGNQGE